jgi:hypothetical protein
MVEKMSNNEKTLLNLWKSLESKKNRDDLLFQAEMMVRAQEAFKADFGLTKPAAPEFFGTDGGKPAA